MSIQNKKQKTKNVEKQIKFKISKNNKKESKKESKNKIGKKVLDGIKRNKKLYMILGGVIIFVILVIFLVILLNRIYINKKYSEYTERMNVYGFDLLYNNECAKAYEKVTKLEAVKLVLGTIYNTYDISYVGYQPTGDYDGDEWIKTAVMFGILEEGEITKDNINDNASYWEFIKMYLNARNQKLGITISYTEESKIKNLNSFSLEQRQYINDLVENGLIQNNKININLNENVIKGKVNEIVINYVDKYNSIAPEGDSLVLKEESKPSNKDYYPYIVYSISNEVYEMKHVGQDEPNYMSPKSVYKYKKEYYNQMRYRLTEYYNNILNIDYKTITKDSFREKIDEFLLYNYEDEIFEDYVEYVKENEITLEGTSTALLPIVYYDGIDFRVRMKLKFKVLSSKTDKNLLFGDSYENPSNPVTYKNNEYEIYIDAPMSSFLNAVSYATEIRSVKNLLTDNSQVENNAF